MGQRRGLSLLGLAVLLHLPSFFRPFADIDEGSYAGIACRLLQGGEVYRDGVENKLPGIFYIYKAIFALAGRYNMLAVHIAVTLVALATARVVAAIAERYSDERGGTWAAVSYLVFSAAYYPKILAGNTEMFAVLPSALAIWTYQLGQRARGTARAPLLFIVAGALGGATFLCKQVAIATFCAMLGDLIGTPILRRLPDGARGLLRDVGCAVLLILGFTILPVALVLHLRSIGVWDDAVFWTYTYVVKHYIPAGSGQHGFLFHVATSLVPFMATMSPLLYLAYRGRSTKQSALYWWFGGNLGAALVGGRMYGHYFVLLLPALATLAGVGAATWLTPARRGIEQRVRAAFVAIAIGFFVYAVVYDSATDSFWSPKPDYRLASQHVRERTKPDDQIFVWGWFPPLYQAADRCPATRFVYTHLHSGKKGAGVEAKHHYVPEAWDMLMVDLEKSKPPYVLDTSKGDYSYDFPPEGFPRLWDYLSAHYEVETTIAGVRLFRRK